MNGTEMVKTQTKTAIHPATQIRGVHYTVSDLNRQVAFYQDILGFRLLWRSGDTGALGTSKHELLRLTEIQGARRARRTTGLYHTAFLVPTRWDLAHLVRQIAETKTPIQGTSNHKTHLAIYLPDAEGNGIELAWDFPKEAWPMKDGKWIMEAMVPSPVDIQGLMTELDRNPSPWTGLDSNTQIGHIHLHVSDLKTSHDFYHNLLGFDVTAYSENFGALFVSAGGYHHHIGLNIWNGVGAPPPPPDAQGLRYFTVGLPSNEALGELRQRLAAKSTPIEEQEDGLFVRDPAQNGILFAVEALIAPGKEPQQ